MNGPWITAGRSILALLLGFGFGGAVMASGVPEPGDERVALEYRLKAALLFKIVQLVEWPAAAGGSDSIRVGVIGDGPFLQALSLVQGKLIHGRPVVVLRFATAAELKPCHVVVIPASAAESTGAVLRSVGSSGTLTVGESDRFLERGGMVHIYVDGKRVRFAVQRDTAAGAGLRFDPYLLELAADR